MEVNEIFMQRAIDLARLGAGKVSPNPLVGCVIVHNGLIIGEGWHQAYGGPHAEVNAVSSVIDKDLLKESTVYVNLEPCSHHGKTPPCADMLVRHQVKKVIVANVDTYEQVSGNGIKKLREADIEVVTGILQEEGRSLNKRFFTFVEKKRPYIILKWAETSDGFIARENYESKWISNVYSRQWVHRWRAEEDAVLVGTGTALRDNPSLNVREWLGRNPVRIVVDRYLKLNNGLNLFDGSQQTICYNTLKDEQQNNVLLVRLDEKNFLSELILDVYKRKIQSVIVEGGARTLELFIKSGLWDEARIFKSRNSFGKGIPAPVLHGHLVSEEDVMGDQLSVFNNVQ
ncbi:MAG: bifunctional diaminohydroxyphosphoribosylaminopyrimidine deaminase/5-amino-6-(5-phosphoribosylamino)uracil reductase RibD [Bacteroidota bacterium]